jgi:MFS family permease
MNRDKLFSLSRTRQHLLYSVFITIVAVIAGYMGILPVFRSYLMRYLGIGDDRFGLLFSIGSITGLSSVLFGGRLIDRWGPRRIIRISLTGIGLSMLLVAFSGQRFLLFATAAGISGIFSAPLFIAINIYLAKLFPKYKRRIISLNLASTSLGGMMFPIVAEWLLHLSQKSETIHFEHILHIPFLFTGTFLISAGFAYRKRFSAGTPPREKNLLHWQWKDLLLPPQTLFLGLLIALHGTADGTLYIWMSRFLESGSFQKEVIPPGIVLSAYGLSYLLSRGILAVLPDRFGRKTFLVFPGIVGGSILIAGLLSRNYILTAGGYVFGAFCWSAEYPAMVSTLIHNDKKRFGSAMAISGLLNGLLLFVTMNLIGLLVKYIHIKHMWKVMLFPACLFPLVGIGGLAWLVFFNKSPR